MSNNNLTSPGGENQSAFPVQLGRLEDLQARSAAARAPPAPSGRRRTAERVRPAPSQVFYLRENALSGNLPEGLFYNMSELRYVLFNDNAITGGVPTEVGRLVKLSGARSHPEPIRRRPTRSHPVSPGAVPPQTSTCTTTS